MNKPYRECSEEEKEKRRAWGRAYYKVHPDIVKNTMKAYYAANTEKVKSSVRDYRLIHPEKVKAGVRLWQNRNPEKVKVYKKKWKMANKNKCSAMAHKRNARIAGNGGSFTAGEWELLKEQYGYRCPACGKREPEIKLTIDHVIPIAKGGVNTISNIQPLCGNCNSKKNTQIMSFAPGGNL